MNQKPRVSVVMITYGHENYIRQAIEGVLMQEGDFELELIIANDCSPDNSDTIINKIISDNTSGHQMKYFKHNQNLGIMPNFYFALEQCTGNFVAMCEGDDYWIDPFKIYRQLQVFKREADVKVVYSNVRVFNQKTEKYFEKPIKFTTRENQVAMMLESKYIEFATTLFERNFLINITNRLKEEMMDKVIGDTRILLEAAHASKLAFVDVITTVYRVNEGSATQPTALGKYIFATLDSYYCRKSFVERYEYPKKLLSRSLLNVFKGFIDKAYGIQNYRNATKVIFNIPFVDLFKYVRFKDFFKFSVMKYFLKVWLILINIKNGR